jgi:hypothetical protein
MNAKKVMRRAKADITSLRPGTNWLTTLGGILLAAGAAAPFLPSPYNAYAGGAGAAGGVLLGLSARQANVTSDQMQTKPPEVTK